MSLDKVYEKCKYFNERGESGMGRLQYNDDGKRVLYLGEGRLDVLRTRTLYMLLL